MPVEENDERASPKSSAEDANEQPPPYTKEGGTRLGTKEDSRGADATEGEGTPEPRDNLRDGT
jgi:hypothetical protein